MNAGTFLLVLWAAFIGITEAAGLIFADSPGGHEGDDINIRCVIRNFHGVSIFFRRVDGRNDILSPSSKYCVFRNNKTILGTRGEDSVLIITKASESDSGTYGCALNVNGKPNWTVSDLTNVTVKPVYSEAADPTYPTSLATHLNHQPEGEKKESTTGDDREQSSQNTGLIAAVIVLSLLVLIVLIVLGTVKSVKCRKQRGRIDGDGQADAEGAGENDGNATHPTEDTILPIE